MFLYHAILSNSQLRNLQKVISKGTFGNRSFHKSVRHESDTSANYQDVCPEGKRSKMDVGCKVALITGGTSGIGLAAASQILNAGARNVILTGINSCEGKEAACFLNSTYGMGKAIFINCSVNCMGAFEAAFKTAMDTYKRVDIVVNSAGICNEQKWEREVVTNVIGTIRGTLLAYRYAGKEGLGKGGCVVNIAGVHGLDPLPSAPVLSACQHAIVGLSKSFGHKSNVKRSGVRVVCLCPGFTQTPFLKNIAERGMTEVMGKKLEKAVKREKNQGPDPVGHAIVHLIKHASSGSVWVCEGARLFSLNLPRRDAYGTLVAQYL